MVTIAGNALSKNDRYGCGDGHSARIHPTSQILITSRYEDVEDCGISFQHHSTLLLN